MPALQVKECPAAVYDRLRECAARENRSISQQALTIIEGYLGMRDIGTPTDLMEATQNLHEPVLAAPENYLERRKKVFDRIAKLRPIPISEKAPNTADILRQIREEEAR